MMTFNQFNYFLDELPVSMHTLLISRKDPHIFAFEPKSDFVYGIDISDIRTEAPPGNDFQVNLSLLLINYLINTRKIPIVQMIYVRFVYPQ